MEDETEKPPVTGSPEKHEGSCESKLWIKLKIGKIEESSEDNQIEIKKNDHPRVCEVCKKGFGSGKALGGHMRVHAQENKGHSIKMNENSTKCKKKNQNAQYLDSLAEKPTCFLCGKSFPSMKSLFGHMRCHPDREWRGIQPPERRNNSSYSSVSDERAIDPVTDLMKSLPAWPATARRGRRAHTASSSSFDDDSLSMSEEEREAVRDLMMLAQGESIDSGLTSKHKFEATNSNSSSTIKAEIEIKNLVFGSKKERIEDSPGGYKKMKFNETGSSEAGIGKNIDKGKGKAMFGSREFAIPEKSVDNFSDDDEFWGKNSDGSVSSDELIMMKLKIKKNKKKKLKLRDLDGINQVQRPIVEYKCNTCNKCFPSHQALGGHRSSHYKFKNNQATTDNESFSPLVSPAEIEGSPPISRDGEMKESNNESTPFQPILTHQCKICNKIFPSGQALGGHKRCHWSAPVEGLFEGQSSQATSPGEASRTGRVLEFDLNELPSMEEEDGGVESQNAAGVFGHASSPHNSVA